MLKPNECIGCSLYDIGTGFSIPEGEGTSGVAIIMEALGHDEAIDGLPARPYAQAGSKLESVFRSIGVNRNHFKLYNVVNCQPPNNFLEGAPYEQSAITHCRTHLDRVLCNFSTPFTRVTLTLGNVATKSLTGLSGLASAKESISHVRGYVFHSAKYGLIVPSLHPSYLRRGNPNLTPFLEDDIKKALRIARGEYTSYKGGKGYIEPKYNTTPGLDDATAFYYRVRDNPKLVLTYDIETPMLAEQEEDERDSVVTEIKQIQFSLGMREGIAFPYMGGYIELAKKILALGNVKANHNTWNFDNPILRANGFEFGGLIHDTLWMFKHWHPNLEKGLQKVVSLFDFPFPWKHLYGQDLEWYGCADVDAVHWILKYLPPLMKARGVWDGYFRHVYGLHTILTKASDRGFPVDEEKRQGLVTEFTEKQEILNARMQELYPEDLKGILPRGKDKVTGEVSYGYLKPPKKDLQAALETYALIKARAEKRGWKFDLRPQDYIFRKLDGLQVLETPDGLRWGRLKEFKPSSKQVIEYLKWKQEQAATKKEAKLYEVPKKLRGDKKTGERRETTGKDELLDIWEKTDDELLRAILQFRSLKKQVTNDLPNWKPEGDGLVHCSWGFTAPTGQLNAYKPNILNASKHLTPEDRTLWGDDIAPKKRFRDIIVAPPGKVILEFDKKSFHVAMMGFIANSKDYIRFSQLDPHSIFGSYIVEGFEPIKMSWSDSDILAASKEFKKTFASVRQDQCKPAVLGNQLGLGARKLQHQNRKFIKTLREAERLQEMLRGLFPEIPKTQEQIRIEAHMKNYLINHFWRIQYFYEVFKFGYNKYKNAWDRSNGDDAEKCLAFAVQSNSFGMITEEILEMERQGINEEFGFVNTIHDSTVFITEKGKVDDCIAAVMKVMGAPCKHLVNSATGPEGLIVKVEPNIGTVFSKMEEIKM